MKILKKYFFLIAITSLFCSCELINPSEDIPAYIKIEEYEFTSIGEESKKPHNITDAWVNIDGNKQGVYELPTTFPVLAEGKHTLLIRPGIKVNGIAASRDIYPFYKEFSLDIIFTPHEITTIKPHTEYKEETVFEWSENFEDAGQSLSNITKTSIVNVNDTVCDGNTSGAIFLTNTDSTRYFEAHTTGFVLPKNRNNPIYQEINYKCDNPFEFGIYINNDKDSSYTKFPVITINPSDSWNKIYIELTHAINDNPIASSYSIYFSALKSDTVDQANIYLDNLKLLHF